jgi:hypothetical protein
VFLVFKGIGHCVHLIRDLNQNRSKRLLNWTKMQKKIGIKEIRLYIFNVTGDVVSSIRENNSNDFIKIIYHHTKFEDVCKKEIKRLNSNPSSIFFRKQHMICENAFKIYFNFNDEMISNAHERINTNDCFFNYKYEYEYVSNYDFDEIILPRNMNNMEKLTCNNSLSTFQNINYNIYDYVDKLFSSYGKFITSCLSFENVIFFPNNHHLDVFLEDLKNNQKYPNSISYKWNGLNHKTINYLMNSNDDLKYSKNLFYNSYLYKCLQNHYQNLFKELIEDNWNNAIASVVNSRSGKSIFNTDNTEAVNQHFSSNSRYSIIRKVPLNLGFTGHFREDISGFIDNQIYPINFFIVDIEYYLFLISLNSN